MNYEINERGFGLDDRRSMEDNHLEIVKWNNFEELGTRLTLKAEQYWNILRAATHSSP